MVPEFTEAAFELKTDGDISKPVRTDYGFHIIKRISARPVPSFEELRKDIESKVSPRYSCYAFTRILCDEIEKGIQVQGKKQKTP